MSGHETSGGRDIFRTVPERHSRGDSGPVRDQEDKEYQPAHRPVGHGKNTVSI